MFAVKATGCGYDERATTAEWDGQATNASAQISAERNSGYRGGYSGLSYRSAGNAPELRADASRARNRPARKIRGRDRCLRAVSAVLLRSKWRLTAPILQPLTFAGP